MKRSARNRSSVAMVAVGSLLTASCVPIETTVAPEVSIQQNVQVPETIRVTVGPRRLIEDISKRILHLDATIEFADPLDVRDTMFPDGGWFLSELMLSTRCTRVHSELGIDFVVLLGTLEYQDNIQGHYMPGAFGAMSGPESSSFGAYILDMARNRLACTIEADARGEQKLGMIGFYGYFVDPQTEEAVLDGVANAIVNTVGEESGNNAVRIAVLAAEARSIVRR